MRASAMLAVFEGEAASVMVHMPLALPGEISQVCWSAGWQSSIREMLASLQRTSFVPLAEISNCEMSEVWIVGPTSMPKRL